MHTFEGVMLRWSAQLLLAAENEISVDGGRRVGRAYAYTMRACIHPITSNCDDGWGSQNLSCMAAK